MSCFSSSYGSSLSSIQSLPSSDRSRNQVALNHCLRLTLNFDDHRFRKSYRSRNQVALNPVRAVAESASCSYTLSARNVPPASVRESFARYDGEPGERLWATSDPGVDISDESQEDMASEKEIGLEEYPYGVAEARASRFTEESGTLGMFKDTICESGSMLLYLPDAAQGKVALSSQQSEHGKIVGNTITAGMPTYNHNTTFFNSPSWHSKTSPPLSKSSFLSSSSPTLKPLRVASPAISFTRRARVVTSSATKSSSTSTLGDTSVSSEEKIYLVFRDAATLATFLDKIREDGLVLTEITYHPRADTLDEASGKKGKAWEVPSDKMYEKCQTGEPDGRIQETLPGYYGPVYTIISVAGVFMIATTMPLTIALILVEKHAQILVEKQLCNSQIVKLCAIDSGGLSNHFADAPHPVKIMNERANDSGDLLNRFPDSQVSLLLVDNHETKGKMDPVINFTSIKYGLIGQLNQHPMSSVGEPLVSSVAEPLIRATDSVGTWGQVSPVAAVIFAAFIILSKILG